MLKCPRCGSLNVKKDGTANRNAQRYACRQDLKVCKWRGSAPVGVDEAKSEGINRALVDAVVKRLRGAKIIVVTSAQNATPVFAPFWKSILTYCRVRGAELAVLPYRYKNATSQWTEKNQEDDWWAAELQPYLMNRRYGVDRHLQILGDIMTQPTATRPLQGYETISGKHSAIVGHPKLELTCVPTPQSRLPKILTTTGAVTRKNYVQAKAGKKGEHHHTFGACVIELADGLFHMRQLNALNDGSFMDLDTEYRGDKVERGIPLEALNMGDTHEEFVSPQVVHGTFGKSGIVPTLKPKIKLWHDIHDFYRRNHHHRGDPFTAVAKHKHDMEDVKAGLLQTFAFLDTHTEPGTQSVVVKSNHPDALARWMKEADWKYDPINAEFYLETALEMVRAAKITDIGAETIDPFKFWGERMLKNASRVRFLGGDESFLVKGIENTYHGHYGANGSRGTLRQFSKIGVKTISGHGHTPGIIGGAYRNGTSTPLKLEFTNGPSSWLNAHTGIYRNGKRTLLFLIDGKWRG